METFLQQMMFMFNNFETSFSLHKAHIIVPFGTKSGVKKVTEAGGTVYLSEKLEVVSDFASINGTSFSDRTVSFFQHRVPDRLSIDFVFGRSGQVDCGEERPKHPWCDSLGFSCVPFVDRPYLSDKSVSDEDMNKKRLCDSGKIKEFNVSYIENGKIITEKSTCEDLKRSRERLSKLLDLDLSSGTSSDSSCQFM